MNRVLAGVVTLVTVVAIGAGAVVLATGDGPTAFSVDGRATSQHAVDEELAAIARNPVAERVLRQQGQTLETTTGSIGAANAAAWVTELVREQSAVADARKAGVRTTAEDRAQGRLIASTFFLGDPRIFDAFPDWFRDRLVDRMSLVSAAARRLTEADPTTIVALAKQACPSNRFVSHVLVASRTEADGLRTQLLGGADFATLARQRSRDSGSATVGGELGCLDQQEFVTAFDAVARAQAIGVVSEPVQTDFGFHLVLVRDQPSDSALRSAATTLLYERAGEARVRVDPRYGRWSASQVVVIPPRSPVPSPGA